ncbi:monocarboxylate transporter 9-like [Gigantopelta aegis]|uniref:monocarboxylate transporter 9-like n=1 Tax=Gigantopelta aegis TaxID=1735272 RepID=UPI001B88C227|nr:monocarboxylate transporter 9-like [Gigantopelta aegis]
MLLSVDIDRGWAWLVAVASFLMHVLMYGVAWSTGIYNAILLDYFHESAATIAWAGSLTPASMYAVGPLAGVLTNRFGCRLTILVGGAISSFGLMISFFAPNIYFLYFSFGIVTGIGLGISFVPAVTCVAHYFEKYRNFATGLAVSGVGVGTFLFPPLITILSHKYTWRGSMLILGALTLNVCLCGTLVRPLPSPRQDFRREKPAAFDLTVFKKAGYLLVCLNNILICFGLSIVYLHLTAFAEASGMSDQDGAMLISVIGIANLVGRFVIGALGSHPRLNVFLLYSLSFMISGTAAAFFPVLHMSFPAMIVLSVMFGFFTASFGALLPALLIEILGLDRLASAYGYLLLFMAVGQMLGGPIAGFIYDKTGSYNSSFYVGGAVIVSSGIMIFFLSFRKRKPFELPTRNIDAADCDEKEPLPA